MIEDMTVRNLSPATQRSYVSAVAKFSRHFGCSPDRLGLEEVRAFQVHLVAGGISWPALNQIVCALRFFYGVTLGQGTLPERIPYAREPRKPPVVLSADEVVAFLEAIPSLTSSSRFRSRSEPSPSRTRPPSTPSCSRPPHRLWRCSPRTRVASAPRSAPSWFFTPGGRRSPIIRTFTASSRAADCRWTEPAGSMARRTSSSP